MKRTQIILMLIGLAILSVAQSPGDRAQVVQKCSDIQPLRHYYTGNFTLEQAVGFWSIIKSNASNNHETI